jgi:hypothetical protein
MRSALRHDPRVTVRTKGQPDPDGRCVVYWMQRAQRAVDNPALDVAVQLGNELRLPVVAFFGLNPFIERANARHYRFLVDGLPDIAAGLRTRRVGFVLRRYPHHRLLPFADELTRISRGRSAGNTIGRGRRDRSMALCARWRTREPCASSTRNATSRTLTRFNLFGLGLAVRIC